MPLPAVADGLTVADVAPTEAGAQSHMAGVILALVAVAFGALDRAHNLVRCCSLRAVQALKISGCICRQTGIQGTQCTCAHDLEEGGEAGALIASREGEGNVWPL